MKFRQPQGGEQMKTKVQAQNGKFLENPLYLTLAPPIVEGIAGKIFLQLQAKIYTENQLSKMHPLVALQTQEVENLVRLEGDLRLDMQGKAHPFLEGKKNFDESKRYSLIY